jgi:Mn2+/Fe2+ NRAMP family transporter
VSSPKSPNEGSAGERRNRPSDRETPGDRGQVVAWPRAGLAPVPAPALEGASQGLRHIMGRVAPAVVNGVADVDPSLVVTATVIGAAYGFSLLWAVVLCAPILVSVFGVAGRIGHETHKGLVDLLRSNYGKLVAGLCALTIILINLVMITADLMAVTDGMSILLGQRRAIFIAVVAFAVWYILIFRDYKRVNHGLVWFCMPVFAYVASAILTGPSPQALLLNTFVPRVLPDPDFLFALVALFGSLLTPYVLVWQTSSRGEEALQGGRPHGAGPHVGGWITVVLAYCVIVSSASVLHIGSPMDLNTRQAAHALAPAVGSFGPILFALAIVGAGMVALPVLVASMCYSVAEAFEWKYGLSEHPWEAKRFYVLISAAMFIGAMANLIHINPVRVLYASQVLAGILTVPILIFILLVSNDRRIMRTTNSRPQNFWIGAGIGALASVGLLMFWWKIH